MKLFVIILEILMIFLLTVNVIVPFLNALVLNNKIDGIKCPDKL